MPLMVAFGTVRFIARPGMGGDVMAPLVGFVHLPMPDGVKPGALIELRLLHDGCATWRVVQEETILNGPKNGKTYDSLYVEGFVRDACWPDLLEEQAAQEKQSELERLADCEDRWAHRGWRGR